MKYITVHAKLLSLASFVKGFIRNNTNISISKSFLGFVKFIKRANKNKLINILKNQTLY